MIGGKKITRYLGSYSDNKSIADWARPYISLMRKYAMFDGYTINTFNSADLMKMQEAAFVLYRLYIQTY